METNSSEDDYDEVLPLSNWNNFIGYLFGPYQRSSDGSVYYSALEPIVDDSLEANPIEYGDIEAIRRKYANIFEQLVSRMESDRLRFLQVFRDFISDLNQFTNHQQSL